MSADAVRLWIIPVDVTPADVARCHDVLDAAERARAAQLRHASDRRRFTVAHAVLRILVGRELAAPPGALTWIPGRHGKPGLTADWGVLHTNLSHSGDLVAVALCRARPVGVDIQQVMPRLDPVGMSARFFAPEEADHVAAGADPLIRADRFAHLWTCKEAVVKAAGDRLWPNLRTAVHGRDIVDCTGRAHRVTDVAAPAGFRAAIALEGAAPYAVTLRSFATASIAARN